MGAMVIYIGKGQTQPNQILIMAVETRIILRLFNSLSKLIITTRSAIMLMSCVFFNASLKSLPLTIPELQFIKVG